MVTCSLLVFILYRKVSGYLYIIPAFNYLVVDDYQHKFLVLLDGFEPSTSPYQRDILPLQTMGAYWYPVSESNREKLLLLRETTLPICPTGR